MSGLKKKIAIVVPDLAHFGGVPAVAKFIYEIINASDDFQAEMISISTSVRDRNSRRILAPSTWFQPLRVSFHDFQGIKYRHIGANWTEIEIFRYRPRKVLDDILNEFDLIQIVAGTPAWGLVAENVKRPVVLQVATLAAVERESQLKQTKLPKRLWLKFMTLLNTRLERKAVRFVKAVLVENKRLFNALNEQANVVFASPGINTDFFCLKDKISENFVLCVGRFDDPRKNVKLLFQAFEIFRREMQEDVKLVLAGKTPPTLSDLEEAKKLGIFNEIEILTDASAEKLRDLYQTAKFFVLSSDEEGLGLVLLEASACGLPIVATKCGGAEEVVVDGETGFLVPRQNASALAEKMLELWHNPKLRAEMREKGRARAVEKFSKEATGKIFLQVYRELLVNEIK